VFHISINQSINQSINHLSLAGDALCVFNVPVR